MDIHLSYIESPLGRIIALASNSGVCILDFDNHKKLDTHIKSLRKMVNPNFIEEPNVHLERLEIELKEYFLRERTEFSIPVDLIGTDFQKKVWTELLKIPYGKTISYLQQATALNTPESVRAVANANGMNKISIIVPCHRVIGSNGKLTGYAGGLDRKQFLLELESPEATIYKMF